MTIREARDRLQEALDELEAAGFTVHGWDDGGLIITDVKSNQQLSVDGNEQG